MSSVMLPTNAMLIGFEELERLFERGPRAQGDGYPPYNIERIAASGSGPERLRITLAVAGFSRDDLDITLEDKRLIIRGKQADEPKKAYIYRGIAARQFSRTFVLADGLEVRSAGLDNGLLTVDLVRREPMHTVKTIAINGG